MMSTLERMHAQLSALDEIVADPETDRLKRQLTELTNATERNINDFAYSIQNKAFWRAFANPLCIPIPENPRDFLEKLACTIAGEDPRESYTTLNDIIRAGGVAGTMKIIYSFEISPTELVSITTDTSRKMTAAALLTIDTSRAVARPTATLILTAAQEDLMWYCIDNMLSITTTCIIFSTMASALAPGSPRASFCILQPIEHLEDILRVYLQPSRVRRIRVLTAADRNAIDQSIDALAVRTKWNDRLPIEPLYFSVESPDQDTYYVCAFSTAKHPQIIFSTRR